MTNKKYKAKKAVLRVDVSKLIEQLRCLFQKGQVMLSQPEIDNGDYNTWFENVKCVLQLGFSDSDNEFYKSFIPLPIDFYASPDNGCFVHIDDHNKLKGYLCEDLARLNNIIDDISTRY